MRKRSSDNLQHLSSQLSRDEDFLGVVCAPTTATKLRRLDLRFPLSADGGHRRELLAIHPRSSNFANYNDGENFTSYGNNGTAPFSSFTNYPDDLFTTLVNDFCSYSRSFASGSEKFVSYGNYGKHAAAKLSEFNSYGNNSNVVASLFLIYETKGAS